MSLSFRKTGIWTEIVGQTPWSARVVANEFTLIQSKQADEGVARRRVGCRPGGLPHFE
jgi:hypothetical protein